MTASSRVVTVTVPGTCGELIQGWSDEWAEPVLVSCPVTLSSRITVEVRPDQPGVTVAEADHCSKIRQAAGLALDYLERPTWGVTITRTSQLIPGRGMASSTADVVGVIMGLAEAVDRPISVAELVRLACRIEPSDSTMLTGLALLAYRGSGQTVQGLATGEIDVAFLSATTIKPLAEAGMARVLGTTGSGRSVTLPDVPPIGDTGVPQFEATTTYGLFVPRATPEAEILRLHEAALQSLAEPLLREKLATEDFEVIGGGPAALDAHVRSETAKWAEIIRVRNITVSN